METSLSAASASPGRHFEQTLQGDLAAIQREYARLCRIEELPEGPPAGVKPRVEAQVGSVVESAGSVAFSLQFLQENSTIYVQVDSRGYTILNPEDLVAAAVPPNEPKLDLTAISSPFESFEQLLAGIRPHTFERFQMNLINDKLRAEMDKPIA
ncbi:hypothetical protein TGRUB_305070 [Toxoplasma gondii RUB]|uniref:Uncharacterized protein n=2 Tax=Toxoplasma gondii TaxID=5811 RepID=A0A086LRG4_TOXGO|nr:hypothetical protein TGP89_305070 [Toxoplasma gondii p89]KFG59232.1 hypothetical protein TGRUB_305070 [Toxoplasma gondii RUB]